MPHARLRFGRHALRSNFWTGQQVGKSGFLRWLSLDRVIKKKAVALRSIALDEDEGTGRTRDVHANKGV